MSFLVFQRRLGRKDMAHGTRWVGEWRRLYWSAFRSKMAMRGIMLQLSFPGRRRVKVTVNADWWKL